MSLFGKLILFSGTSAAALYLGYKLWKRRNDSQDSTAVTEVGTLDANEEDDKSTDHDIGKNCDFEERLKEGIANESLDKEETPVEGVQLWIDEGVQEYYSMNAGPSSYDNVKQELLDHIIDTEIWENGNSEDVKSYVMHYLNGERSHLIPEVLSKDVVDVPPSQIDKESSSVSNEIEEYCNRFFGITFAEYSALEEERYNRIMEEEARLSTEKMRETPEVSLDESAKSGNLKTTSNELEEKDDKKVKKTKSKKSWKKRITNFFQRLKVSKKK